jgi:hypothetical protein
MYDNYRRRLVRPWYAARFRKVLAECRADLDEQHFQHLCELAELRKELDTVRAQYEALRGAVLEREQAEANLELLKRDRERRERIVEGERFWLH